jgi:hypothetical protein
MALHGNGHARPQRASRTTIAAWHLVFVLSSPPYFLWNTFAAQALSNFGFSVVSLGRLLISLFDGAFDNLWLQAASLIKFSQGVVRPTRLSCA